jgi:predicted Zn-dependent protease
MRSTLTPKTVRRLLAADGFLDLDMPAEAIAELDRITDAGPLEGPRRLLLGIALKAAGRMDDAIRSLELAARIMPSPIRRFAWRELVDCYSAVGSEEMAELAGTLGGSENLQLRIALPCSNLTLDIDAPAKTG